MLTQQQYDDAVSTDTETNGPTLADSVRDTVQNYIDTMEGEAIADLYDMVLAEVEAPLLECLLAHTRGNQSRTASILGLNRGTLRKKLKRYGML